MRMELDNDDSKENCRTMRHSKTLLTAGCFLAFFAFGFIDNLKGPILPELLRMALLTLTSTTRRN